VLRIRLLEQVAAMRRHAPWVSPDNEVELHELRLAARRLRELLGFARPLLNEARADSLRLDLRDLHRRLGPARDADVFVAHLRDELAEQRETGSEAAALLGRAEAKRLEAYRTARAAVDDASFERLLENLADLVADVRIDSAGFEDLMSTEATKVPKRVAELSSDESLHQTRIKARRLRFAADIAGDRSTSARAKRLQDFLGEHHDAVVAEQRLRELAEPGTATVVGRLIELEAERRGRARRLAATAWEMLADGRVIRAAGGIVVRGDDILIVHRPKYDDWSLPKGKCRSGEMDEACAIREVAEETGFECRIVRRLGATRYRAAAGAKVVQWFLMHRVRGDFEPGDEVDEIAWVPRGSALEAITFDVGAEQLSSI
jgi:8-oxo-dGTP diphosphatase